MNRIIAWFAENHVAANLLMVLILVAGMATAFMIKVEVMPDVSLDTISITTEYEGASPDEMVDGVVRPIEEEISGLAGIKRIDSTAQEGNSSIAIEVVKGWDLSKLLNEVKAKVDGMTTLPEDAEKPVVSEDIHKHEVLLLALYGDAPEATLKSLAQRFKTQLVGVEGVTQVSLLAVRDQEVQIEVPEEALRRHGLTLEQVADTVRRASMDLPAGSVRTADGQILIRSKGKRYWAQNYSGIAVVTNTDGSKVTLGEIAVLRDGFKEEDNAAIFQGKPAAIIQVWRVADQNAIDVANATKEFMEQFRPGLPAGVQIDVMHDDSEVLKSRINLLIKNMSLGLVLVVVLLGLFLNLRLSFWVTLGIPISFAFGMLLLPSQDLSINMVSLFGFIMVLGIVVDDAVVIGENVHRKREEGMPPLKAAVSGALEVGKPVVFSVLTTIVAFMPLTMGSGMLGKLIANLPIVVIAVLLGSLVESLLILPAHLAGSKKPPVKDKMTARWLKALAKGPYQKLIRFCIRWRYAVLCCGLLVALLTAGTLASGLLKFTFFPKVEDDQMTCEVTMPAATPKARLFEIVDQLEKSGLATLAKYDAQRPKNAPPLFRLSLSSVLETAKGKTAKVRIRVLEPEDREVGTDELLQAWRASSPEIGGAEAISFYSHIFNMGNPLEVHLTMEDEAQLMAAAEELKKELASYPGVFDVNDNCFPGKPEMRLDLKPTARSLGLTLNDLAHQVRHAFFGAKALTLIRGQDEVKVMVRYPEGQRVSINDLERMYIRTADGHEVPFSEVARVTFAQSYSSIERAQRKRVIKVWADVDESVTNANQLRQALNREFLPSLKEKHFGLAYVMEGEGKEQSTAMNDVYLGFGLALFGIYVLLAIPFKSYLQPFIVLMAVPFGFTGAVLGHLITGYNLSILSVFGMVGLAGVVVNDSLVMVDAVNRMKDGGMPTGEAVVQGGMIRFRAIILTSVTTFAGLLPMLFEQSTQAQFLIPMAVSLGFGVLFATFVTLLLVPCGYEVLEDAKKLSENLQARMHQPRGSSKRLADNSAR